jgi:hypothetical protein
LAVDGVRARLFAARFFGDWLPHRGDYEDKRPVLHREGAGRAASQ